ncbi:MAG: ABC transporter permease [Bryobacteraceae bacterium]
MEADFLSGWLASAIRIATPLIVGALGGLISERAGVFAVGIEGMMLAGAFGASVGMFFTESTAAGIVAAVVAGIFPAALVAVAVTRFRADQMVTGLAINVLTLGLTSYLIRGLFDGRPPSIRIALLQPVPIPMLSKIPGVGPILFQQPALAYSAVALAVLLWLVLQHTSVGLTLRATGENPEAVFAAGNNPVAIRQLAVIACGAIAGLGGAVLVLQDVGTFTDGMTGGRGFLALAALIVGRWNPLGVVASCLMFGAASALEVRLQGETLFVDSYVIQMVPYGIALLALIVLGRGARMPKAIGRAYSIQ